MKKTLIVSALALAITSSLVAGTLATYTKTLTPIEATVTAKKFNIERTEITNAALKLAPGEKSAWNFSVSNSENGQVTETDMDLRVKLTLSGEAVVDGLSVKLYDADKKAYLGEAIVNAGEAEFFLKKAFVAGVASSRNFEVQATFDNAAGVQNGNSTAIQVAIAGEQTPVKYVYTRDKNGGTKTTATQTTAVYVESNAITLLGNEYYGDAVFTKRADGKYDLTSSTLQPQYVGKVFGKTDNVNSYAFMLQTGGGATEMVIEVGNYRSVQ